VTDAAASAVATHFTSDKFFGDLGSMGAGMFKKGGGGGKKTMAEMMMASTSSSAAEAAKKGGKQ